MDSKIKDGFAGNGFGNISSVHHGFVFYFPSKSFSLRSSWNRMFPSIPLQGRDMKALCKRRGGICNDNVLRAIVYKAVFFFLLQRDIEQNPDAAVLPSSMRILFERQRSFTVPPIGAFDWKSDPVLCLHPKIFTQPIASAQAREFFKIIQFQHHETPEKLRRGQKAIDEGTFSIIYRFYPVVRGLKLPYVRVFQVRALRPFPDPRASWKALPCPGRPCRCTVL